MGPVEVNKISPSSNTIRIGDRAIGPKEPCFVIAEIGNNHNGDFDRAIALVDAAIVTGADCAKFQMRKLDEVYRAKSLLGKKMTFLLNTHWIYFAASN